MKYTPETVEKICELMSTGDYSQRDVCKIVGISEETIITWKKEKVEFSELLKEADKKRQEQFKVMARSGLAKLLDVFEYEETSIEYVDKDGKPRIKNKKVVTKKIMPNPTAVIFALTNRDPDNYRHMQQVDHTTKGDKIKSMVHVYLPDNTGDDE